MRSQIEAAGLLRSVLVLLGSSSLTACLIVPTPEISEIRESRLEVIEPGITTRSYLEGTLLSGDVFRARVSPPYTIYAEYRSSFAFAVFGPSGGGGQIYGNVDDYLVVEYDENDRVVQFERLRDEGECTSYGLCVSGGSRRNATERRRKDPDSLVVYAPTQDDEALKRFTATGGACSVYAFSDGANRCDSVALDVGHSVAGSPAGRVTRADSGGYFHWSVPVTGSLPTSGAVFAQATGGGLADHDYQCSEGEVLFLEIFLSSCASKTPRTSFIPLTRSDGEAEISARRQMLLR